ncbi:MAG: hypothetical protein PGN13_13290 [Patulibacter minatonensis]
MQSVLEDAVLRGRMTRRDAEDRLATSLVTLGREQAQELRSALARLRRPRRSTTVGEAVAKTHSAVTGAASKPRRRPRPAPANGHHRTGRRRRDHRARGAGPARRRAVSCQATRRRRRPRPSSISPAALSTSELWTLRELEAAGKARATVLRAIDRKLNR